MRFEEGCWWARGRNMADGEGVLWSVPLVFTSSWIERQSGFYYSLLHVLLVLVSSISKRRRASGFRGFAVRSVVSCCINNDDLGAYR